MCHKFSQPLQIPRFPRSPESIILVAYCSLLSTPVHNFFCEVSNMLTMPSGFVLPVYKWKIVWNVTKNLLWTRLLLSLDITSPWSACLSVAGMTHRGASPVWKWRYNLGPQEPCFETCWNRCEPAGSWLGFPTSQLWTAEARWNHIAPEIVGGLHKVGD